MLNVKIWTVIIRPVLVVQVGVGFGIFFASLFGFPLSDSKYRSIGFRFFTTIGTVHISSVLLFCCMPKCTTCNLTHAHSIHVSTNSTLCAYGRGR